jgi:hypothetical protein
MKIILAAALCTAAMIGQISTASAQYYRGYGPPPGGYYGGGGGYYDPTPGGYLGPRHQPMGYGEPS